MTTRSDGTAAPGEIERRSIRRNIAMMTGSQIITWSLATVGSVMVPRYLGPTAQGELQHSYALWAIPSIFATMGTASFLQLAIARDQPAGLEYVAPVLGLRTFAFCVASVLIAGYTTLTGSDRNLVVFLVLGGLGVLMTLWADAFGAAFTGLERMSVLAVSGVVVKWFGLVATLAVLLAGGGAVEILLVGVIGGFVWLGSLMWHFRKLTKLRVRGWSRKLWPVAKGAAPFMVVALALSAYRQIDILTIAQVAGERDVGWYSTADTLVGSLMAPTSVILAAVFPTLGRLHATDAVGLRELVHKIFSLLIVVAVPVGLGAAACGPAFARLILGDEYSGTGTLLAILGPVTILTFANTVLATVAVATDRQRFVVLLLLASAAVTVPLDLFLVPYTADRYDNGALGGGLAFVVTETLQFVVSLMVVAPHLATRAVAWRTLRVLACGGAMLVAVWPIRDWFVLVPGAIGALVYGIAIVGLRIPDDYQRNLVKDTLRRMRPRRWRAS